MKKWEKEVILMREIRTPCCNSTRFSSGRIRDEIYIKTQIEPHRMCFMTEIKNEFWSQRIQLPISRSTSPHHQVVFNLAFLPALPASLLIASRSLDLNRFNLS